MKTLAKAVAISSLVLAGSQVMAEDVGSGFDVSGNVGVVSDYVFRGISQSNGSGAIQGGFDLKHSSGAYAGTWMSSLGSTLGNAEQDLYVGYGYKLNDDVSFDARLTEFRYIDASNTNYYESHLSSTFYNITLGLDYTPDLQIIGASSTTTTDNSAIHYYGSYTYTFPMDFVATATVGHQDLKDKVMGTAPADLVDGWTYWNLGVAKKLVGINWGLTLNHTDLSSKECGGNNNCDSTWVLSATKSL